MAINITGISVLDPRRQEVTSPEGMFSVLQDQQKRLTVFFEDILQPDIDAEAEPDIRRYNPDEIDFIVFDAFDKELRTGSLAGGEVKKASDGEFYIETRPEDPPTLDKSDTADAGLQTLLWKSRRLADSEEDQAFQYLLIYPLIVAKLFPRLKNQIDKAQKDTGTTVGYSQANLALYLQGALEQINGYQPLTMLTFNNFPFQFFGQLLIDSATLVALFSQGLFAIDTDMSYSDQGFSFVIDHWNKISGFISMMSSRLETRLHAFKLAYADFGSLHVQQGPNFRLTQLLTAAPEGALFRNIFNR